MRFSSVFLDELRSKNDIETVVAPYVQLRRSGRLLSGLCPFHGEKTPSFYVYPETQSYYCFGCGAGGDVITFIRTAENLSYPDAVRFLANRAGMRMPDEVIDDGIERLKKRCLSANREAAKFFHACLYSDLGNEGLQYLKGRGLTDSTIRHFGLGFAPNTWGSLIQHLRAQGFREDELIQFNLARKSKSGGAYDAFRNRVMFPIIDLQGSVIAFGGRVMDDAKPKYLNSSDTIVYKKSRGVFALNFAKNTGDRRFILCEGYMDVISLHQAGFTNAVAGLGTALTEEQALLLSRYADEISICYDADEAGRKAAEKAVRIFSSTNVKVKVLRLTGGKDPDEILKKHGPEKMRAILAGALNDTEFRLEQTKEGLDLSTADGKLSYANAAVQVLSLIANPIERELYASRVADETGVRKEAIAAQIAVKQKENRRTKERQRFRNIEQQLNGYEKSEFYPAGTPLKIRRAEEQLLASLFRNPDFYHSACLDLTDDDFISDTNRRIFHHLVSFIQAAQTPDIHSFNEVLSTEEMGHLSKLITGQDILANSPKECADYIAVLREGKRQRHPTDVSRLSDEDFLKLFSNNN